MAKRLTSASSEVDNPLGIAAAASPPPQYNGAGEWPQSGQTNAGHHVSSLVYAVIHNVNDAIPHHRRRAVITQPISDCFPLFAVIMSLF